MEIKVQSSVVFHYGFNLFCIEELKVTSEVTEGYLYYKPSIQQCNFVCTSTKCSISNKRNKEFKYCISINEDSRHCTSLSF